ncbi:MAG: AMP-binding protein [Actinomycetota bacterium]|nr:AMP-binding protein [Actinomycetota bacterium]
METIPHLVLANAQRFHDEPALRRRVGGVWETMTWGEYGASVRQVAGAMIASGIEAGDRVAIIAYNTPEWVIFDVAAMAIGAVPVGIYFSSSEEEIAEMLERSRARIVLAETAAHVEKIAAVAHPRLDLIVGVDAAPGDAISWSSFVERAEGTDPMAVEARLADLRPGDPGTIIFTAAGHGNTVGVVLTHDNLFFTSWSSIDLFDVHQSDVALSYLPLSHIAEQIFTILAPAQVGYSVAFAQSLGRVRVDLPEIQPTIFFGVPLVWTGFARAVKKQIDGLDGFKRKVADWSMAAVRRDIATRNAGRSSGLFQRAETAVARRMFTDRAKKAMGFSRTKAVFSGAASADPAGLEYLAGLDVPIRQVYGLSEATGPSSVTREGADRYGAVGYPMPGVEISLADDGEILIRGRSVFSGYLDDEEATRQALRDGWLHTGDLGTMGEDRQLTISGRKKDIVITTGGKNVCPRALEVLLMEEQAIVDAVVVGDGYDQLGVLIKVEDGFSDDPDEALAYARSVVKIVNERFARAEQIRRVGLLSRPLSVELGERSASGEVHRNAVVDHFAGEIEDLYR